MGSQISVEAICIQLVNLKTVRKIFLKPEVSLREKWTELVLEIIDQNIKSCLRLVFVMIVSSLQKLYKFSPSVWCIKLACVSSWHYMFWTVLLGWQYGAGGRLFLADTIYCRVRLLAVEADLVTLDTARVCEREREWERDTSLHCCKARQI